MDAIGSAFNGLQRATQQLNSSAQRIAAGEIEAAPIVESKVAETAFRANLATLETVFDTQESILDILA